MNDNVMMTNAVICFEDRAKARKLALDRVSGYLVTMVNLYHDTMPKSPDAITWPNPPIVLRDIAGDDPEAFLDELIAGGYMMVGTPDEVSEQLERLQDGRAATSSCSAFRRTSTATRSSSCSSCSATRSSPSTTPTACTPPTATGRRPKPKYPTFNEPLPDIEWPTTLPVTATPYARHVQGATASAVMKPLGRYTPMSMFSCMP